MRRLIALSSRFGSLATVLLMLLAVGIATARDAGGQQSPVEPEPTLCQVEPRPAAASAGAAATPADATPPASPEPVVDPAVWDRLAGRPAEPEEELALVATVTELLACANAGDPHRAAALVADEFWRRRSPATAAIALTAVPAERPAEEWLGIIWIEDVRVLEDGSAAVFLLINDPTHEPSEITLGMRLVWTGDRWLMADLVRLADDLPVAYDLPVFRPTDAAAPGRADELAGAPTLVGSYRLVPAAFGGRFATDAEIVPAQEIVDHLRANRTIRLEAVQISGELDLRGVPADEVVAVNVRFLDGFVASLPDVPNQTWTEGEERVRFQFVDTAFSGPVDFRLDRFETLECDGCVFEDAAIFHSVDATAMTMRGTRFEGDAVFVDLAVAGTLDLTGARFEGDVDLTGARLGGLDITGMTTGEPIQIGWDQFGDAWLDERVAWATGGDLTDLPAHLREILTPSDDEVRSRLQQIETSLRFWRSNFEDLGRDRDARTVYRELVELRQTHALEWTDWEKWEAWFKGLGSAYGTEPYRPLVIAAVLVVGFAVVYRAADPFVETACGEGIGRGKKTMFSFFYSVDAFVPFAVVTGVKDWEWQFKRDVRWVVVFERVLGAIFTVLIAYNVGSYLL